MTASMKILYFLFIRATVSFLPRALRNDFSTTFQTFQRENYRQTLNMVQHQPLDGDSVLESLHQYRKTYSNLNVPFSFVVPNDTNWPAHLHGFRLGTVLRRIKYNAALPEYHPQLEKIGFQVSTVDYKFEIFIKALKTYKELNNGCTQVPIDFVVPTSNLWPEDCWGCKLGRKVGSTRSRKIHTSPECVSRINELSFVWDPSQRAVDLFLTTLKSFKLANGHLNIPKNYIIPHESVIYPKEAWGMKIGLKTHNFIYRGDYTLYKEQLEEIGLSSVKLGFDTRHWDYIYTALKTYDTIYGHSRVPASFMVPSNEPWPKSIWGLKLGYRIHNIRYRGDFVNDRPEYRVLLEDLGFRCDKLRKTSTAQIVE